jgi:hypothetical protein
MYAKLLDRFSSVTGFRNQHKITLCAQDGSETLAQHWMIIYG